MTRLINKLSTISVQKLNTPGLYSDGGGLWLQVKSARAKSWIFRFDLDQRRRHMGLGSAITLSLAQAREKARECRVLLLEGIDPLEHRKQTELDVQLAKSRRKTFMECCDEYITSHEKGWKNDKHARQWRTSLDTYAAPVIGHIAVADIDTNHMLEILLPIWADKTETANRIRGRIESILDWAKVKKFRTGDNPAQWKGNLEIMLPARQKVKKTVHHPAMPYKEIPEFFKQLRERDGLSARALEFAILNASRAGEIFGATWQEMNFDDRLWIIPAQRMKSAREHRIPLTDEAIQLLQGLPGYSLPEIQRENSYLFPSTQKGKPLSNMAMTTVLRRMNKGDVTQHGFRSSFRDWAAEVVHYPREVIEHALAHKLADEVEAAYQRGDLLDKRRELMNDWTGFCCQQLTIES